VSTKSQSRKILAGAATAALAGFCLSAAPAQAQNNQCQKLQQSYQQELGSAESLKAQAAKQAMQSGSNALSQFGIQLPSSGNAQQAIQKGALAATSPQMQGAIVIQLMSANTHLQEMIWRGCKPSSG
jgi:hypothetical protein